ncbi:hypothetical protein QLS91_12945 [Flavobacterium sp. LB2P84]|uniref:hypothetical protein n=1 Tax=Flavobacterium yafengii TaxID=3041253 RepID=UPI0024A95208|nr:hypothetical protein [Flavobacterium yafengii]MDI6033981.1 hypothetical protein [Flavobacterium yafengii]
MLNEIKPYFFYSPINSIRMAETVQWGIYKPKTVGNTLSFQENGINKKDFFQLYQFNDAVRNQFKSSFSTHEITINGCDGSITNILPKQRTDNLNVLDYRTAKKNSVDGFLVVYFGSGSILEYGTNAFIESYNLYQFLPDWITPSKNIEVDGFGEVSIDKIIWLEDQAIYAVKTFTSYSNLIETTTKVKSVYNKFDYDIFEFDIDFSLFPKGKYQIKIKATDAIFQEVNYCSERISLKEVHENTHHVIYENDKNNQINYGWGIQHMMRLECETELKYSPDGENEVHKTDNDTILLNATNFESYEMELSPLPTAMAIKSTSAFSLSSLFVDTRSYVSDSKPTIDKLVNSNLYDFKVKMTLSNKPFIDRSNNFRSLLNQHPLQDVDGLIIGNDNNLSFIIP